MRSTTSNIHFNASTVLLQGSNLIEASAGTGKTYSIAILVLRLVLEKQLSVREILMVTFTKAAVAELEERIRLFIRDAYKVSLGEYISDNTIAELVNKAMTTTSSEEVQGLLKQAVLFLDETAILTIHSFCQQTLTEFAFETNQLFGAETLQDSLSIIRQEVNKFWRKNITTIPVDLLEKLLPLGVSRENINKVVQEHLDGKMYLEYDATQSYSFCEADLEERLTAIRAIEQKEAKLRECLMQHINENVDHYTQISRANRYARNSILPLVNKPEEFLNTIKAKRDNNYILDLFSHILEKSDECARILDERNKALQKLVSRLNCLAIQEVSEGLHEYKQHNNLMSFDDMIIHVHTSVVVRNQPYLISALQNKYKAVFVDEFQDTDRMQYEIFQKAFGERTILFYIGDPKQSIYAWRKADIFTYFKAGEAVDQTYGMNQNFRSSAKYIEAMNLFFKPAPGFDSFYFAGAEHGIEYIHVESALKNTKGNLYRGNQTEVPITICQNENNDALVKSVAAQLIDLLENKTYAIGEPGKVRRITPADIGILVRTNKQAMDIKSILSRYGIPAVTIDDSKILQSVEATSLLYLLEAMIDLSPSTINRALLSAFTGYNIPDILSLNDEHAISLFRKYKITWEADNIYTALMDFVADYRVHQVLLHGNTEDGEKIITNLFQLIELLHKQQSSKKLSPIELIGWLKRGIEGMEMEGDEFEQRMESDEDAVKIVTIHKSKGLEYNIVLAPFLDFARERKDDRFSSFRDPGTGEYVVVEKDLLTKDQRTWVEQQAEQENRRLLYVTITRAVYAAFIFQNTYFRSSTLTTFLNALTGADPSLIRYGSFPVIPPGYTRFNSHVWQPVVYEKAEGFHLQQKNWSRMSYTMLSAKHEPAYKTWMNSSTDRYDHFVFNQLAKGSKTGNLLHFVFENIHFADNSKWEFVISEAIRRFVPRHREIYLPMIQEMLKQVLYSPIMIDGIQFRLSDISNEYRIHEFEFDFPVPVFNAAALNHLSDDKVQIQVRNLYELEGVMNGKVDMFFEYDNKYFILDWKSNFLGDSLKDYSPPMLAVAMNENNYHLQYLIYTLAAKKYLETRLPGFNYEKDFGGVIYLFVRGLRKHAGSGIFTCRPALSKINQLESILSD